MKQNFFYPLLPTIIFLFIFMVLQNFALANWDRYAGTADITITGKIMSSLGEPVRGASVQIKNSSVGTTTNDEGDFVITAPENAILVISSVGYASQEVSIEGRTSVSLTLVPLENTMNEVVVVGYGSQRRKM